MKITTKQLAAAYFESTADASEAETIKIAKSFVEMLRKRKLLKKKETLLQDLEALQNARESRLTATVRTAKKLTTEETQAIKRSIKNSYAVTSVELEEVIDTSLIGGADIQIGWEKISGSIQHRLHTLHQSL